MEFNKDQFIWPEKYRPHKIKDCILPKELLVPFSEFVAKKEIPNLLLSGTSGVGKTTVARALCEELNADYLLINAGEESGIDVLRVKMRNFAASVSLEGGIKIIILDEADRLNPNTTQPALHGFIEEFASNCRFIFTCNHKSRIIPPLHSRTTNIDFRLKPEDRPKMAAKFMKRIKEILDAESIQYDEKVVVQLINKHFPDYRHILNDLQWYSSTGKIDEGVLALVGETNMTELIESLKEKNFTKMRTWAEKTEPDALMFRSLFDTLSPLVKETPKLVILLNDYQYKAAFVADSNLNLAACLTEIMVTVTFK